MFSSNPKRPIVSLAVVAGLLAAAVPASAQGGGADFTRERIDDHCCTIAAKESAQPEGIIAVLIGAVQPNGGPARSGEIVTGAGDDRVRASGLKAGSSEVLMETVTATTRPEVDDEVLAGYAFGSSARSVVVEKDLNQPDM